MDERDIVAILRQDVEEDAYFADASVSEPLTEAPGFVLNFPHGTFLVTVVQIGE